jgi:hypothetical protein
VASILKRELLGQIFILELILRKPSFSNLENNSYSDCYYVSLKKHQGLLHVAYYNSCIMNINGVKSEALLRNISKIGSAIV